MTTTTEIGETAFTRGARTQRRHCGAKPAVCDRCVEVMETDGDDLICHSCGQRCPVESLSPCPRTAIARVIDEDGAEDRLCASHAAVWRRLGAHARETLTAPTNATV